MSFLDLFRFHGTGGHVKASLLPPTRWFPVPFGGRGDPEPLYAGATSPLVRGSEVDAAGPREVAKACADLHEKGRVAWLSWRPGRR